LGPFDGKIISPKTRLTGTIDNVKAKINKMNAKIDNVEVKTQDEEDPGPRSRPSLARRPVPGQLGAPLTSSLLEGPPPTSLRLARQVSAPCELPRLRLGRGPRHAVRPLDADVSTATRGGPIPCAMQAHQMTADASSWPRQEP
jgi:hypothetical protein